MHDAEGDFTGPLLRSPDDQFTELRAALGFDAILDYDAQAALRRVRVPMLWVVAGKDTEAPSADAPFCPLHSAGRVLRRCGRARSPKCLRARQEAGGRKKV